MKLINLMAFSLMILFGVMVSCRKKTDLPIPGQAEVVSYTCLNGVMDGNEDGVDCGPECEPCVLSLADCFGVVENEFTASSITTSFSAGQVIASNTTGALVVTGTNGSKFVRATFGSANPTVFTSYTCIQWGTPGAGEVKLEYNNGTYLYTGYSDVVHLNRINGKLSIEFCDVYMSTPSVGGYIVGKGKLTEN